MMRYARLAFWWFFIVSGLGDGFQGNVGPFQTAQECEEHRAIYATKFYGWISAECQPKPVVLIHTGEAS